MNHTFHGGHADEPGLHQVHSLQLHAHFEAVVGAVLVGGRRQLPSWPGLGPSAHPGRQGAERTTGGEGPLEKAPSDSDPTELSSQGPAPVEKGLVYTGALRVSMSQAFLQVAAPSSNDLEEGVEIATTDVGAASLPEPARVSSPC